MLRGIFLAHTCMIICLGCAFIFMYGRVCMCMETHSCKNTWLNMLCTRDWRLKHSKKLHIRRNCTFEETFADIYSIRLTRTEPAKSRSSTSKLACKVVRISPQDLALIAPFSRYPACVYSYSSSASSCLLSSLISLFVVLFLLLLLQFQLDPARTQQCVFHCMCASVFIGFSWDSLDATVRMGRKRRHASSSRLDLTT